jgi:predicted RNase H-like nuclease (RuvC/YqgF family)
MQPMCRILLLFFGVSWFAALAYTQDSPALGDAARQARQQKQQQQQQKDAQAKDPQGKAAAGPKTAKVISNDDIPAHTVPAAHHAGSGDNPEANQESATQPSSSGAKIPAEQWKTQILSLKNAIAALESDIARLNDSIHFAPANCVANCVQWNERQQQKQQQVEVMKSQLEDQQKKLEDMQESARQQGYGSSVYDP